MNVLHPRVKLDFTKNKESFQKYALFLQKNVQSYDLYWCFVFMVSNIALPVFAFSN